MDDKAVIDRTNYILGLAAKKYGPLPHVEISFYNKGRTAGQAWVKNGEYGVRFSREGIRQSDVQANLTISHEIAHIVCFYHYENYKHNKQWKRICIALGGDGKTRCKGLKLTPRRIHLYFQYLLDDGRIAWMGKTRHRRIQKGGKYILPKLGRQMVTKDHYTGKIGNKLSIDMAA